MPAGRAQAGAAATEPGLPRSTAAAVLEGIWAGAGTEQEPAECWICRDVSHEPLLQPCACRGSMSGVHASCVERWVAHHRAVSSRRDSEAPECPVCRQPYRGAVRHPGLGAFACQLCRRAACTLQQIAVWLILCSFFVCVWGRPSRQDTEECSGGILGRAPGAVRVAAAAAFVLGATHTILVLTVSLPPTEPPPQNPVVRLFFVSHRWRLLWHIVDALIFMLILFNRFVSGSLGLEGFLPFVALAAVPYSKCVWHVAGLRRTRLGRGNQLSHCCWLAAACLPKLLQQLLPRDWRRACHPLGPGPHILVALASVVMSSQSKERRPVLVLWAAHGVVLLAGLVEVLAVRRLRWQKGTRWAVAVWFAICGSLAAQGSAGVAGWQSASSGEGLAGGRPLLAAASLGWLGAVTALAVAVNWAICVRIFRMWQRRHSTFALQATPQSALDMAGVAEEPGFAEERAIAAGYVALPGSP